MSGAVCTRSILSGWRMSYRGLVEVSCGVRTTCSVGAPPNTALSAKPTPDHRANRAWAQGHLAALRVPLFCRGLAQRVVSANCADRVSVRRSVPSVFFGKVPPGIFAPSGTQARACSGSAGGEQATGGFQKKGTFMTADADESLEYKQAKMGIVFTCSTCETRVTRVFSKRSYEKGVVIVRVEKEDGCNRADRDHCMHLIADNLGWFEDNAVNVEIMAARRGQRVERVRVSDTSEPSATEGANLIDQVQRAQATQSKTVIKEDDGEVLQMYLDGLPSQEGVGDGGSAGGEESPPLIK